MIPEWMGIPFTNSVSTFLINKGLKVARKLLGDINDLGVPCGVEFLDTLTPQYIGDLVSWVF